MVPRIGARGPWFCKPDTVGARPAGSLSSTGPPVPDRAGPLNTQTHLLLAAAAGTAAAAPRPPRTVTVGALLAGALVPDASLFAMWGWAKLAGVPEERIWRELYYSDLWQGAGAVTNSAPLFGVALAAGLALRRAGPGAARVGAPLAAFAVGALLHVAADWPLHHDDGHPHLWPFSDWIFASPVSYWDPAHHGRAWSAFETAGGVALAAWLWRRAPRAGARRGVVRGALGLAAASYFAAAAYWLALFG